MGDLSQLIADKNDNRRRQSFTQLSIVREDSNEDDNRTIINEEYAYDKQSDTSEFDIIESIYDINERNKGIKSY